MITQDDLAFSHDTQRNFSVAVYWPKSNKYPVVSIAFCSPKDQFSRPFVRGMHRGRIQQYLNDPFKHHNFVFLADCDSFLDELKEKSARELAYEIKTIMRNSLYDNDFTRTYDNTLDMVCDITNLVCNFCWN